MERRGARYFVLDLGSTDHTRVNGAKVSERELLHGDEVRSARARSKFVVEGAPPPAEGAT